MRLLLLLKIKKKLRKWLRVLDFYKLSVCVCIVKRAMVGISMFSRLETTTYYTSSPSSHEKSQFYRLEQRPQALCLDFISPPLFICTKPDYLGLDSRHGFHLWRLQESPCPALLNSKRVLPLTLFSFIVLPNCSTTSVYRGEKIGWGKNFWTKPFFPQQKCRFGSTKAFKKCVSILVNCFAQN